MNFYFRTFYSPKHGLGNYERVKRFAYYLKKNKKNKIILNSEKEIYPEQLNNYKIFERKQIIESINKINNLKNNFPFYSLNDVKFRILRDYGLNKFQYHLIMKSLFKEKKFNYNKIINQLFINKTQLKHIKRLGHSIGLHTHNHPTLIEKYSVEKQLYEYKKNIKFLKNILNTNYQFKFMSHPNGSYNKNTSKVLNKLNIELGFTSNKDVDKRKGMHKINNSKFEVAREDHSNIMNYINEK